MLWVQQLKFASTPNDSDGLFHLAASLESLQYCLAHRMDFMKHFIPPRRNER